MYILPETTLSELSHHTPLTVQEALSGAFGSVSITCWIFLLVPQLIENYRNQSAEALSIPFLIIWLVGDIANLFGGIWADLVPTVIAVGVYFCFQDFVLISQSLYYNIRNRRREGKSWIAAARASVVSADIPSEAAEAIGRVQRQTQPQPQAVDSDEEQPLLKRTTSNTARHRHSVNFPPAAGIGPAQRRSSHNEEMARRRSSTADNHLVKILEEQDSTSGARLWFKNVLSIIAVFVVGTVGWFLAYQSGAWKPAPLHDQPGDVETIARGAQVLGYISAVAYLAARIPQIIKNWREQSCEGLSLLFFILSLFGNLTYGASILCHSRERSYVIKNVPWLIGSLGTMVEDVVIFVQFHIYGTDNETAVGD